MSQVGTTWRKYQKGTREIMMQGVFHRSNIRQRAEDAIRSTRVRFTLVAILAACAGAASGAAIVA
jgi:hypothetical protein